MVSKQFLFISFTIGFQAANLAYNRGLVERSGVARTLVEVGIAGLMNKLLEATRILHFILLYYSD